MKWFYRRENREIDAISNCNFGYVPRKNREPTARWIISIHVNSEHLWLLFSNMSRKWVVPLWQGMTSTSVPKEDRGGTQLTLSSEAPDTSFSVLCYIPASSLLCPFPFWLYFQINCSYLWDSKLSSGTGNARQRGDFSTAASPAASLLCVQHVALSTSLLFSKQKDNTPSKSMQ